jgi:hypothetical protein
MFNKPRDIKRSLAMADDGKSPKDFMMQHNDEILPFFAIFWAVS